MNFKKYIILLLCWVVQAESEQLQMDFLKALEFSPNKNLKIIILDKDLKPKEVLDINTKETKNVNLNLPDDENFYISIIPQSLESKKEESDELINSLKQSSVEENSTVKVEKDSQEIVIHRKNVYEGYFERNRFFGDFLGFEPNRSNYILPFNISSTRETSDGKRVEAKFQISIKKRLAADLFFQNLDLYFAYTQQSFWQVYDGKNSRPFRESNYEPSLFMSYPTREGYPLFFDRVNIGYVHQSNGGDLLKSRSWDRVFIEGIASRGDFIIGLKAWYRIPESFLKDDNPDITKYLGNGELLMGYLYGKHFLTFTLRNNLRIDNKGSILI
ncbi:MAG: phospholipase A, partial [Helicobacter sp.]|nr:phospholipase A [Helicobacter sp.]